MAVREGGVPLAWHTFPLLNSGILGDCMAHIQGLGRQVGEPEDVFSCECTAECSIEKQETLGIGSPVQKIKEFSHLMFNVQEYCFLQRQAAQ